MTAKFATTCGVCGAPVRPGEEIARAGKGWLSRGWVTSARKPVVSRDLWEPLITEVNARGDVSFRWTKGLAGDEMNDLVDRLAVEQSKSVSAS